MVGCGCPARHVAKLQEDGTVVVTFTGLHNHDVQQKHLVQFVNPIKTCREIRSIVDNKLMSGVPNNGDISRSVIEDLMEDRNDFKSLHKQRLFHMAKALTRQVGACTTVIDIRKDYQINYQIVRTNTTKDLLIDLIVGRTQHSFVTLIRTQSLLLV